MNKCHNCKWWGIFIPTLIKEPEYGKYYCYKIHELVWTKYTIKTEADFGCILWEKKENDK